MAFNFLKRKRAEAGAEMKKLANRDLMQGVVAIGHLVMWSDKTASDEERNKLDATLKAHPALQGFGSELDKTIGDLDGIFAGSVRQGKIQAMKEVKDLAHHSEDDRTTVLVCGLDIAEASGDISPEEQKVLEECARELGLDLKKLM